MGRLDGKVAIVTGGGGGIGAATCRTLAREGAAVMVVDINEAAAALVVEEVVGSGGSAKLLVGDLSGETAAVWAVSMTVEAFGRLDILHNNAALTDSEALSKDTAVTEMTVEVWEQTMAVNLRSQMLMTKHAIPEMVRHGGGSIINMSSGAAFKGDRTRTAYGVSKAGVHALTMYSATSHGKEGIRVNTVVPGLIITDSVKAHLTEKMLAGLSKVPLTPHLGEPSDIADLVLFLASDESRYITGQMIVIDGGMSAHVSLGSDS